VGREPLNPLLDRSRLVSCVRDPSQVGTDVAVRYRGGVPEPQVNHACEAFQSRAEALPALQLVKVREVQQLQAAELAQACDIFDVQAVPEKGDLSLARLPRIWMSATPRYTVDRSSQASLVSPLNCLGSPETREVPARLR